MNSTIKIDYERGQNIPVIKIITPSETHPLREDTPGFNVNVDEDVRDKLIADLLHSPNKADRNGWFELKSYHPIMNGNLTTIGAVDEKDLFYRFKHSILVRVVPYLDLVKINRGEISNKAPSEIESIEEERFRHSHEKYIQINAFFNWLDETGYCTWEEQQAELEMADKNSAKWMNKKGPVNPRTRRDYFELELDQDMRIRAFEHTPKERLDEVVAGLGEAMGYVPRIQG